MGLMSQLPGSIMPARDRSVAMLALCSCPLASAPAPPKCHPRLGRGFFVMSHPAGSSATPSPSGSAPKTLEGECRSHACMGMAEPQGFLQSPETLENTIKNFFAGFNRCFKRNILCKGCLPSIVTPSSLKNGAP